MGGTKYQDLVTVSMFTFKSFSYSPSLSWCVLLTALIRNILMSVMLLRVTLRYWLSYILSLLVDSRAGTLSFSGCGDGNLSSSCTRPYCVIPWLCLLCWRSIPPVPGPFQVSKWPRDSQLTRVSLRLSFRNTETKWLVIMLQTDCLCHNSALTRNPALYTLSYLDGNICRQPRQHHNTIERNSHLSFTLFKLKHQL